MKKLLILLFIAVIGLTAKIYGQGTCASAVSLQNNSNITTPLNTDVFWCNVVPENDSMIYTFSTNNDTTALIATVSLYKGGCDSLELINTYTVNDSTSFIELFNLQPNNNYFFKVNFNNTLNGNFIMYSIIVPSGTPCPTPASCSLVKNYDFELIRDNINASNAFGSNQVCHWKEAWGTPSWTNAAYLWSYSNNSEAIFQDGMTLQPNIEYTITYDYLLQSVRVNSINVGLTNYPLPNPNLMAADPTTLGFSMLDIGTINFQYNAPLNTWYHYSNEFTPNIAYNNLVIYPLYPNHPSITPFVVIDNIVIKPKLIFQNLQNPQTICIGNNTTIQPIVPTANITSWHWTSNPVGFSATTQNITVSPSVNTLYSVVAKDANGCEWTGAYTVLLTTAPNITPLTITSDWGGKPCSEGVNFTFPLPATPGITYTWTLPNNATIATTTATNNITVNWNNAGIATVIVEGRNANGCLVYQGSLLVNPNQTTCTATYAINNLNATQIKTMFGGASTITTTQPILINGIITINENLTFDACSNIKLGLNAKINVMPGCTLNILNSTLNACDCLWDGIFVESSGARLYITNSYVSGAKNAVVSSYDGKINLYNSTFTDNQLGVWIRKYNPQPFQYPNGTIFLPPSHSAYIAKCLFNSNTKHYLKGIRIDTVYNVTIGDVSNITNRNEFYKLNNAISSTASDVNIYNNYFNNCERSTEPNPSYWYSEPDDAAIFIKRPYQQGPATLPNTSAIKNIVTIGGAATNQSNTFYLQNVGVYGFNTQVHVRNNTFTEQRFSAVHLRDLYLSDINFNTITMQNTTWATNNLYNATILAEHSQATATVRINANNNTINNTRTGINTRNCNGDGFFYYCNVKTNLINFSTVTPSSSQRYYGISASNCEYAEIESNSMSYYTNNNYHSYLLGIYLSTVQNAKVSINLLAFMGDGIYIAGSSLGSQYFCNNLNKCWYGFYFDNATLSHQLLNPIGNNNTSDNYWQDAPILGNDALRRMEGTMASVNTINWLHRGLTNNINNSRSPYILFGDPLYGAILPVPNQAANTNCTAWRVRDAVGREALLGNIVRDNMNYEILPEENEYMGKEFAYKELDKNSASLTLLAPEDSLYQQFYTTAKLSNMGKNDEVSKAVNTKDYTTALSINTAIVPQNTIEFNRKTVYGIYLEKLANNIALPSADSLVLLTIAMQTPFEGGDAVYAARVILGIDPLQYNLAYAKPPVHQPIAAAADKAEIKVYPNPANNALFVELTNEMQGNILLEIFDINGKLAFTQILNAKQKNQNIDISSVKKGIYNLRIRANDDIVKYQKLVIIK